MELFFCWIQHNKGKDCCTETAIESDNLSSRFQNELHRLRRDIFKKRLQMHPWLQLQLRLTEHMWRWISTILSTTKKSGNGSKVSSSVFCLRCLTLILKDSRWRYNMWDFCISNFVFLHHHRCFQQCSNRRNPQVCWRCWNVQESENETKHGVNKTLKRYLVCDCVCLSHIR